MKLQIAKSDRKPKSKILSAKEFKNKLSTLFQTDNKAVKMIDIAVDCLAVLNAVNAGHVTVRQMNDAIERTENIIEVLQSKGK